MNGHAGAIADLVAWLVLGLITVLAVGGAIYFDFRAWLRTQRNRRVLTCIQPRCVECARKLDLVAPFAPDAVHIERCAGCGVHLQARRVGTMWQVCTVAEAKRQRTAPLPAIAPPSRCLDRTEEHA